MALYSVIARAVRLVAISRYVILSVTKDLKACTASTATEASRFFTSFRMTAHGIIM